MYRAIFPKGRQKQFLLDAKELLGLTWISFANFLSISNRNLTDWRKEKISLPLTVVEKISKKTGKKVPGNLTIKDRYWYTKKGAQKGGMATYHKYGRIGGDPVKRKEQWGKWWKTKGKFITSSITRPWKFHRPNFSEELAEFVGIVLGDGGISRNQIVITLNRETDKAYSLYVRKLIEKLFRVKPGVYCHLKSLADAIVISRTGLVNYCIEFLGMKMGSKVKHQVDIPEWIKKNDQYKISCLRGLIDTDGCTIIHRYRSKRRIYRYKKISFTNRSLPLIASVRAALSSLQIGNRITKDGFNVRIEARADVDKYFELVGTRNPKHLGKYQS